MDEAKRSLRTIFNEALEIDAAAERAAYLKEACGEDSALRRKLQELLDAHAQAGGFFAPTAATQTMRLEDPAVGDAAGSLIGRYKLLQKIGEGGCGVVYMAEQHEPVRRRVALKVIKPGMDSQQVIARFEAERQALALMDHPNIARVFDAGATETGRPYFVMELVRGLKITEYCDEQKLPTVQRLQLFVQVCQAVQHAHQKGVIHRDLKPSNILVTTNDGVAVPKVIDFGIAKATTGQPLANKTVFTAFEQFIGTPAYMSPEQAVLTSVDIDTRTDIYSLGVLLYELLTGATPFDAKELLEAGLDEMRRTIREREPQRPSTRVSTLRGDELTTAAKRRGLEPPKLINALRGDLDWIVMKCLEKDRARRYETANGLARDIQRHLENEPVVACPPSNLYRFQKLVRRNKLLVGAGTAVGLSLLIGLALSTVMFLRARAEARRASEQAAIAHAVSDFLQQDLLLQADSEEQVDRKFEPDPNLTVRVALERAAGRIGDRFKEQPLVEAAVQLSIGQALAGVGEFERAGEHIQRALEVRRANLGPDHPDTLKAMESVGLTYMHAGKLDLALPLLEKAFTLRKARLGAEHPDTIESMHGLGAAYVKAGKTARAIPLLDETLRLRKARFGLRQPETLSLMNTLAVAYLQAGQLDQALPLLEETLKLSNTELGPEHPSSLVYMCDLAGAYQAAGKLDLAVPLYEVALNVEKAKLGPDHPRTLTTMGNLAYVYTGVEVKHEEGVHLLEETFKLMKARLGPEHPKTLSCMNNLAGVYMSTDLEQATTLLWQVADVVEKRQYQIQHAYSYVERLIGCLHWLHRYPEEEVWHRKLLAAIKEHEGAESQDYASRLANFGSSLLERKQWTNAEEVLRECLSIREKIQPDKWFTFNTKSGLGGALLGQRRFVEAEPLLVAGDEGMKQRGASIPAQGKPRLREAVDRLVELYQSWNKPEQLAKWQPEFERLHRLKDEGAIRHWLILAPIALTGSNGETGLEQEQVAGEASLRPRADDKVQLGGGELMWQTDHLEKDYAIDFNALLGKETRFSIAYAVCYLTSSVARKDLLLHVGSDDQARVYLNGRQVYENRKRRALVVDEDVATGIELRAGLNVVVFKIVNETLDWAGSLRFSDKDGNPVQGITVTLNPDQDSKP
jgi:serine/threonine protein kinase